MFVHRRNGEAPDNRRLRVGKPPDVRKEEGIDRVEILIPYLKMQMSVAGAAFSAVCHHLAFSNGIFAGLKFHFDGEFTPFQLFSANGTLELILESAEMRVRCIKSIGVPKHEIPAVAVRGNFDTSNVAVARSVDFNRRFYCLYQCRCRHGNGMTGTQQTRM